MENSHAHDRVRPVASPLAGGTKQGSPMHIYGAVVLRDGIISHLVPIVLRLIGTPHMWAPLCTREPSVKTEPLPMKYYAPSHLWGCSPPHV